MFPEVELLDHFIYFYFYFYFFSCWVIQLIERQTRFLQEFTYMEVAA